jgi:hypothetical protein
MFDSTDLKEFIKKILPIPSMRWVAIITITLVFYIPGLPLYLKENWPKLIIPEILLFKMALITTVFSIGSLIMFGLSLWHIKNLNKSLESKLQPSVPEKLSSKFDATTGTWLEDSTGLRYCGVCQSKEIISPLKIEKYGWYCLTCKLTFDDPSRPRAPETRKKVWIPD